MKLLTRLFFPLQPGAFRLALALLVFLHHCSRLGFGKYAVYVFFVLSGFWVDRMWTERYSKARNPLFTYGLSRAWRLLPTFILVGLIVTGVQLLIGVPPAEFTENNPWHLMLSSIFIFGYSSLPHPPVGPAWSLDIEVQYYVIAPIISVIAQRYGAKFLFLIAIVLSAIAGLTIAPPMLINYIFFFVCGMSASVLNWRPSQALALSSMSLMIVVLVVLVASPLRGALLGGEHLTAAYEWNPLLNIFGAVLSIPFAIYTTRQKSDRTDRMMADLSYVIYLAHWPVFILLAMQGGSVMHKLPYLIAGWGVVISGSWAIWRYFEQPINKQRAIWVGARLHQRPDPVPKEVTAP